MAHVLKIDPKKFAEEVVSREKKRIRELELFFESEKFNQLIDRIRKVDHIDGENLVYRTQKVRGLNPRDFDYVCDAIFNALRDSAKHSRPSGFEKYSIDYKGIRFNLLMGQGAVYWTERLSVNEKST